MPLFSIPQFIERETPIIGPLTLKQFIFILVFGAICFTLYNLFPKFLALPLVFIVGLFGISLAFLKIGQIPFYKILLDGLAFFSKPKKFTWGKRGTITSPIFEKIEFKKEEKVKVKLKMGGKLKETVVQVETKK